MLLLQREIERPAGIEVGAGVAERPEEEEESGVGSRIQVGELAAVAEERDGVVQRESEGAQSHGV